MRKAESEFRQPKGGRIGPPEGGVASSFFLRKGLKAARQDVLTRTCREPNLRPVRVLLPGLSYLSRLRGYSSGARRPPHWFSGRGDATSSPVKRGRNGAPECFLPPPKQIPPRPLHVTAPLSYSQVSLTRSGGAKDTVRRRIRAASAHRGAKWFPFFSGWGATDSSRIDSDMPLMEIRFALFRVFP